MSKVPIISFIIFFFSFFTVLYCQEAEVPLTTNKGPIVGLRFDPNSATGVSYDAFLGIPYGEKPVRFQVAKARSNWTQALAAKTDGPVCPQAGVTFSEDCLYLNVFTPMNASNTPGEYPVMVFIHGAAFTYGSSSSKSLGPDFLVNSSVILVTMNYRIGAAGFLTLGSTVAPGNLGLHDTLLALQWVQDEISTFGGDPTKVTLFGQSSGSAMTQMHYLSSLSAGLFKRVISQSGSALADWVFYTATEGARRARLLADAVGCDSTQSDSDLLSCLQQMNINYIVGNQSVALSDDDIASGNYLRFIPVLDTYLTAATPFFNDTMDNLMANALSRSKPIITGFNHDEGIVKFVDDSWLLVEDNLDAFIPYSALSVLSDDQVTVLTKTIKDRYFNETPDQNKVEDLVNIYTDAMFAYSSVEMTRYFANLTYGYLFSYDGSWAATPSYFAAYRMNGVAHGAELNYMFYSSSSPQDNATCEANVDNVNMKNRMVHWWTTFAKAGVPGSDWLTVADWPTVASGGYLVIDTTLSTMNVTAFESRYYDFWAVMSQTTTSSATTDKITTFTLFVAVSVVFTKIFCCS